MSVVEAGSIRNKDDLVVELMTLDLRNLNDVDKAYDLFVENKRLFELENRVDLLITKLLEVKCYIQKVHSNVIQFLNDINRNDITSEKFYDLLLRLPFWFGYSYNLDDRDMDEVPKSCCQEKINTILGEDSSTIFKNDEFQKCVDDFIHLCDIIQNFYVKLLPYFENSSVESFSPNQRNSMRNCLVEFYSSEFYVSRDVLKMRNYVKDNVDNIGMYYFVRIMRILNMIGRYSFDNLNLQLLGIARDVDKKWVENERKQLPEFRKLVFNFFAIDIIKDDDSTWKKALDILKEIIKFFRLERCLSLINDFTDVKRTSSNDKIIGFYPKFKKHVKNCYKNDFQ